MTHDDADIILLLEQRDEQALAALRKKYEKSCRTVALQYVESKEDADEILNDVFYQVWNAIPPAHPDNLFGFLAGLTKRIAISRFRLNHAAKRGGGERAAVLEELADCLPAQQDVEQSVESRQLAAALNRFLADLKPDIRTVLVQRYVNLLPVKEIADTYQISESRVKSILFRARKKLRRFLEQEEWL